MIDTDRERFATALLATFEVYGKELSDMVVKVWWAALKPHNIDEVCSALTKHISDPERGQFPPKPADVIRFMETGEKEQLENLKSKAEMQWFNVTHAISQCGTYRTPKFKDPITAAAVNSLGGWVHICQKTTQQLEFLQRQFVSTYVDFERRPIEHLPCHVSGLEDIQRHKLENKTGFEALEKGLADYQARKQAS